MTHQVAGMGEFKWQGSYGAFTLARDALPAVRVYIADQKRHHARNDLWLDYEQM